MKLISDVNYRNKTEVMNQQYYEINYTDKILP